MHLDFFFFLTLIIKHQYMTKCVGVNKQGCQKPCVWIVGHGCRNGKDPKTAALLEEAKRKALEAKAKKAAAALKKKAEAAEKKAKAKEALAKKKEKEAAKKAAAKEKAAAKKTKAVPKKVPTAPKKVKKTSEADAAPKTKTTKSVKKAVSPKSKQKKDMPPSEFIELEQIPTYSDEHVRVTILGSGDDYIPRPFHLSKDEMLVNYQYLSATAIRNIVKRHMQRKMGIDIKKYTMFEYVFYAADKKKFIIVARRPAAQPKKYDIVGIEFMIDNGKVTKIDKTFDVLLSNIGINEHKVTLYDKSRLFNMKSVYPQMGKLYGSNIWVLQTSWF